MLTREDHISQSVADFVKSRLQSRGYDEPKVRWLDAYPATLQRLSANLIAVGFNFDDDGHEGEMGSDLIVRDYTFEFFVFGLTDTAARNIAQQVKFALQHDPAQTIPLIDVESGDEIDRLIVNSATAQRQVIVEPEPWQEFVWTASGILRDEYYASLA
jgi:hypothetical protein